MKAIVVIPPRAGGGPLAEERQKDKRYEPDILDCGGLFRSALTVGHRRGDIARHYRIDADVLR